MLARHGTDSIVNTCATGGVKFPNDDPSLPVPSVTKKENAANSMESMKFIILKSDHGKSMAKWGKKSIII